jgi:hypothetical protein
VSSRLPAYGFAALIGIVAACLALPLETMLGTGPGWARPSPDIAQSLTGHLAFQYDAWRWPPLDAKTLFWPRGVSIALSDSNPLFSLIAKLWVKLSGRAPVNLLGAWEVFYWVMQPIAGVFAARGLRLPLLPSLAAGVLAACWPALLFRFGHINLCGHFLLLLSLGLVFRRISTAPDVKIVGRWLAPMGVLFVAVFTQPYLYVLCVALLATIPLDAALPPRRAGWWQDIVAFGVAIGVPVLVLNTLSGPLGGGDKGFVFFSMNVLSPVWPAISGVFGATIPVIDATGGQYEGYNWLGAGAALLVLVALATLFRHRPAPRPWRALIVVLVGLTLVSLSSRVYVGHFKLIDLGAKPWEDIFAVFRSSGRAFWPVGYAIMLFAVAGVARLPRAVAAPLFAAACLLQFIDTGPLRANERRNWAEGTQVPVPVPALPVATRLLTVAPYPGCSKEFAVRASEEEMLLDAARRGLPLGEIGLGRAPNWFACETIPTDALELPFAPGEVRGFFSAELRARLRPQLFGETASCADDGNAIICGRDAGALPGIPLPAAEPVTPIDLPATRSAHGLDGLLASGWHTDAAGVAWSEGPYSSLVLAVPPDTDVVVGLSLTGIAFRAGDARDVTVTAGRATIATLALPDQTKQDITLKVTRADMPGGLLRLAFAVRRAVDPARRGFSAPVERAALRLDSVTVRRD